MKTPDKMKICLILLGGLSAIAILTFFLARQKNDSAQYDLNAPVDFLVVGDFGMIEKEEFLNFKKWPNKVTIIEMSNVTALARAGDSNSVIVVYGRGGSITTGRIEEGKTLRFKSIADLEKFYSIGPDAWTEKPTLGRIYVQKSQKFTPKLPSNSTERQGEQDGGGQPATRPELK